MFPFGEERRDHEATHSIQLAHIRQYALLPLVRQLAHMCRYGRVVGDTVGLSGGRRDEEVASCYGPGAMPSVNRLPRLPQRLFRGDAS